jgi:hypothetical protein
VTLFIRLRDKDCSYPTSLLEIIYIISSSLFNFRHERVRACVRECVCVCERERDSACVSACTRERKSVEKELMIEKKMIEQLSLLVLRVAEL